MVITILTKDVGDVKDRFRRECSFKLQPEDGISKRFKLDMQIKSDFRKLKNEVMLW